MKSIQIDSAPGYSRAEVISDYTIALPVGDSSAILNLVTGRYWFGKNSEVSLARNKVEEEAGHQLANKRLLDLEDRYSNHRETTERHTSLVLLPTYGCNVSCGYCYEGKLTKSKIYWSSSEADKALIAIRNLLAERAIRTTNASLSVLGGEVIQADHMHALLTLLSGASALGITAIRVLTNGLELEDHARALRESGVTSVMVTIDGPRDTHNARRPAKDKDKSSFDRAIAGIASALEQGLKVSVRVNVDDRNIDDVATLGEEFSKRKFFECTRFSSYIYPVSTDFRTNRRFATELELAERLAQNVLQHPILHKFVWDFHGLDTIYTMRNRDALSPKLRYCGATTDQYVLDTNWNLYPCWFGTGKDGFKIGSLDQNAPVLRVDGELDKKWRSRGPTQIEPCKTCKWAMICGSGCSFKAQLRTSDFFQPNCASFEGIINALGPLLLAGDPTAENSENLDASEYERTFPLQEGGA